MPCGTTFLLRRCDGEKCWAERTSVRIDLELLRFCLVERTPPALHIYMYVLILILVLLSIDSDTNINTSNNFNTVTNTVNDPHTNTSFRRSE